MSHQEELCWYVDSYHGENCFHRDYCNVKTVPNSPRRGLRPITPVQHEPSAVGVERAGRAIDMIYVVCSEVRPTINLR